jgi:hypothetical protein
MSIRNKLTTEENVKLFEIVSPLLTSTLYEMREFSKKKQDGVLNTLKVKMINRLLDSSLKILKNEDSIVFLEKLDEDTLPQNSDVVLILSQFIDALSLFRNEYYRDYKRHTQEKP